jgi:hypothetical protein
VRVSIVRVFACLCVCIAVVNVLQLCNALQLCNGTNVPLKQEDDDEIIEYTPKKRARVIEGGPGEFGPLLEQLRYGKVLSVTRCPSLSPARFLFRVCVL